MRAAGHDHERPGRDLSEDLVAVVLRADRLGFCRWRIATALEISASGLEAIEQRAGLPSSNGTAIAPADRPPR